MAVCRYRKVFDDHTDDRSTPLAAVFEGQELLAKYLEEDEKWLIQTAVWNKLWRRSLSEGLKFPQSLYEDMYFTIRLLARSKKSVYLDTAFYNYYCSRAESTTNIGLSQKTFDDLIPNFYDRRLPAGNRQGDSGAFAGLLSVQDGRCCSTRRCRGAGMRAKRSTRRFWRRTSGGETILSGGIFHSAGQP